MVAANHRVPRRPAPALRLKSVLRAELRELEEGAGRAGGSWRKMRQPGRRGAGGSWRKIHWPERDVGVTDVDAGAHGEQRGGPQELRASREAEGAGGDGHGGNQPDIWNPGDGTRGITVYARGNRIKKSRPPALENGMANTLSHTPLFSPPSSALRGWESTGGAPPLRSVPKAARPACPGIVRRTAPPRISLRYDPGVGKPTLERHKMFGGKARVVMHKLVRAS